MMDIFKTISILLLSGVVTTIVILFLGFIFLTLLGIVKKPWITFIGVFIIGFVLGFVGLLSLRYFAQLIYMDGFKAGGIIFLILGCINAFIRMLNKINEKDALRIEFIVFFGFFLGFMTFLNSIQGGFK